MDESLENRQACNEKDDGIFKNAAESPNASGVQGEVLNVLLSYLEDSVSTPPEARTSKTIFSPELNYMEEKNPKELIVSGNELNAKEKDIPDKLGLLQDDDTLSQFQCDSENVVGVAETESQTIDVADESSSMNRILAWDPWASLNLLQKEVLAIPLSESVTEKTPLIHSTNEAQHTLAVAHSAEIERGTSILKGSPRRTNSASASTTFSARNNLFEPLPIGDTAVNKHVQWRRDVEVTYYTFDSEGQIVMTTQVEPLHEESDQHPRPLHYARASTKGFKVGPKLEDWFPDLNLN